MAYVVNSNPPLVEYTAAPGQTVYTFDFLVPTAADLKVNIDGVLKVNAIDYTVTGAGDPAGGSISYFGSPILGGEAVALSRSVQIQRTTNFPLSGPFDIDRLNDELGLITMILQEQALLPGQAAESAQTALNALAQLQFAVAAWDADADTRLDTINAAVQAAQDFAAAAATFDPANYTSNGNLPEAVQDIIGAILTGAGLATVTYDDTGNTHQVNVPVATQAEAEAGTVSNKAMTPQRTAQAINAKRQLLHVRDEKPSGTAGGGSIAGWNTRALNTVLVNEITGATLASNQVTLPAGSYDIEAFASSYQPNRAKLVLWNVTAGALLKEGASDYANSTGGASVFSRVHHRAVLAGTTVIELRHYAENARVTDGLGVATNVAGYLEVYSEMKIRKVA